MSLVRSFKRTVLIAEVILGLFAARMLIKLVPFRWWRQTLGTINEAEQHAQIDLSPKQLKMALDIGRMIKRLAAKQKFEAVCFPQAMTARWILKRRGIGSSIVLGSRQDAETGLAMHAWLKVGDHVVTGRDEYEDFNSFTRNRKET